MPELPEMEAWRRELDGPVSAFPIAKAGPAHIATLKTFDPPLSALEGRRLAGAERRGEAAPVPDRGRRARPARAPDDRGATALRARGREGPKTPAFRLAFEGGAELILTEAGKKKRAGVWLLPPEAVELELGAPGAGSERGRRGPARRDPRGESRRLHSLLRDQRVIAASAGRGRTRSSMPRNCPLMPCPGPGPAKVEHLADAIHSELERGLELRERGANDAKTYRVHKKLGEPCTRAARRSRRSTSRSTRSTTAPSARPAGACSRTGGCRACSAEALREDELAKLLAAAADCRPHRGSDAPGACARALGDHLPRDLRELALDSAHRAVLRRTNPRVSGASSDDLGTRQVAAGGGGGTGGGGGGGLVVEEAVVAEAEAEEVVAVEVEAAEAEAVAAPLARSTA